MEGRVPSTDWAEDDGSQEQRGLIRCQSKHCHAAFSFIHRSRDNTLPGALALPARAPHAKMIYKEANAVALARLPSSRTFPPYRLKTEASCNPTALLPRTPVFTSDCVAFHPSLAFSRSCPYCHIQCHLFRALHSSHQHPSAFLTRPRSFRPVPCIPPSRPVGRVHNLLKSPLACLVFESAH
jgi:hypothetical protein